MVRCAREKSASGIYHVMLRGINRQSIFGEDEDYQRFLETLKRVKESGSCAVYGYCLMGNHVHLLLHEKDDALATIMKRIGTSYAWWYNQKYDRVGHVFQNRFQSETVETEEYLWGVLRYIHNNPVKAKLAVLPEEYNWSSCQAYYGEADTLGLVDVSFILDSLNSKRDIAIKQFAEFMQESNFDQFMDVSEKLKKSDADLAQEVRELLNGQPIAILQSLDVEQRNNIIRQIKGIEGVTQRQIARVTGIHQSIVFKV